MSTPTVSVVIATYNRSNILKFAIDSVRWQTFADWELIIVGDACTDDTAAVVEEVAHRDSRIRFFNLEQNIGEQSGPNNFGCRQAKGHYIAFLNHDDMWLPDHLETLHREIENRDGDLVHSMLVMVRPQADMRNAIYGVRINPAVPPDVPASSWLFRRELIEEIGPWRFCRECCAVPSQDWLFRAWKARKKILSVPLLSVVAVSSHGRPNSYKNRLCEDHQEYAARIQNEPDFRQRELAAYDVTTEEELRVVLSKQKPGPDLHPIATYPRRLAHWRFYWLVRKVARLCGAHPLGVEMWVRHRGRRGGSIDELRRIRGLPKLK